jgi:hypothetical protein
VPFKIAVKIQRMTPNTVIWILQVGGISLHTYLLFYFL